MSIDWIKKTYWTTGEVAIRLGIPQSKLRFWEREFALEIKRSHVRSYREFTAEDIALVEKINYLLTVRKFTIAGAKQELLLTKLNKPTDEKQD